MRRFTESLIFPIVAVVLSGPVQASGPDPRDLTDQLTMISQDDIGSSTRYLMKPLGYSARSVVKPAGTSIVWDNGGFVTHPDAGEDGADVSMASEDHNEAGDNVRRWEDNDYFRMTDRFLLDERAFISHVSTFGYEPFEFPPTWSTGDMRIWRGFPEAPGSQLVFEHEYDELEYAFTGVYRVLHLADLDDDRRAVFEILWSLSEIKNGTPLLLESGEYWIDWQVVGGTTGWALRVMEANSNDPDDPTTVPGTAHQFRPVGWTPTEFSMPFTIFGLSDLVFKDKFELIE